MNDPRLFSTSAARNKTVIAEAFLRLCPCATDVLEIASGTGEHAEAIVQRQPSLHWQASDPDPAARASSTARMTGLGQQPALALDTRIERWWQTITTPINILVAINMIHITSRQGYENVFRGAGELLPSDGCLFLYGPMSRRGVMEDSNKAFHQSLKARDVEWGVRDLDDTLQPLAAYHGLFLAHAERVPANNHVVVFNRGGSLEG